MRKIFTLFVFFICSVICVLGQSIGTRFQDNGIYYRITSINGVNGATTNEVWVTYYYHNSSSNGSFYKNTSYTIPQTVNYNGVDYSVTAIDSYAFYYGEAKSITIPESVTTIYSNAFEYCSNLTTLTIPESVTSVYRSAFERTPWYNNLENGEIYIGKVLYRYKGTMPDNTIINVKEGTTIIGDNVFNGCKGLTSITIPESVTQIGNYAFQGCTGLTAISIPDGVTNIGNYTFQGCTGLTAISIPDGVTNIGNYAFKGCTGLTSISIPDGVIEIEDNAFYYCSNLTTITIPSSVTKIGSSAFNLYSNDNLNTIMYCYAITPPLISGFSGRRISLYVLANSVDSYKNTQYWQDCYIFSIYNMYAESNNDIFGTTSISKETAEEGEVVIFTATPANGYVFTKWDDGNTDNPRKVIVKENTYLVAQFSPKPDENANVVQPVQYSVKAISSNDIQGSAVASESTAEAGTIVTFTATAAEGYIFTKWDDGNTDNPRKVIVKSNTYFVAEFAPKPDENTNVVQPVQYSVKAISSNDIQGSAVASESTAEAGTIVTFTATATEGYIFTKWDDGNTDNPRNVIVKGNTYFVAEFAPKPDENANVVQPVQYSVKAISSNDIQGSAVASESTVEAGTIVTITATPAEGYIFAKWDDGNTDNPRNVIVKGNTYFVAEFAPKPDENANVVQPVQYSVKAISSNDIQGSAVASESTAEAGTIVTFTATAAEGYIFTKWDDGNTDNPRNVIVKGNTYFVAEFAPKPDENANVVQPIQYSVKAISSNDIQGSAVASESTVEAGTIVTFTATPAEGYIFAKWDDGNTDNPRKVIVKGNTYFVAQFAMEGNETNNTTSQTEPTQFKIMAISNNDALGTVSVNQQTAEEGDVVTFTATAADGYVFTKWDDGNTDNPRKVIVKGNTYFVAQFASNAVDITTNDVSDLSVYPSPATDIIMINGADIDSFVRVYNINGTMVCAENLIGNRLNVSRLKQGVYFVQLENGKRLKFVKN